jgi:type I restriction enzyme M protein
MASDGFSLDDKRLPEAENDIPDILKCWQKRAEGAFQQERDERIGVLRGQLEPLNAERLRLEEELNRLSFEQAISAEGDGPAAEALAGVKHRLEELGQALAPLRNEFNQLGRQFWVAKEQVKANKYDLSASRYRQAVAEGEYYEKPKLTLERMNQIEHVMLDEIRQLNELLR